ncbi:MAG: hypothetical protein OEL76_14410 [Siculibacillus sp.]|nr:hypothetical protein [Siculibacillus sp.]
MPLLNFKLDTPSERSQRLTGTIKNDENHSILITYPLTNGETSDEGRFYVYLRAGELCIGSIAWPIPDMVDVYAPETPLLTRVEAGEAFTISATIPTIGYLSYPYMSVDDAGGVLADAKRFESAVFELGIIDNSRSAKSLDVTPTKQRHFQGSYGLIFHNQFIVRTPVRLTTPLEIKSQ